MEQQSTKAGRPAFGCLIADDSAFARKNIANVVTQLGGTIVGEATNGNEAVELYFKLRPDLMLLDITMPLQDGVDTLQKIIEGDREAKVIMVSSIGQCTPSTVLILSAITVSCFTSTPFSSQ